MTRAKREREIATKTNVARAARFRDASCLWLLSYAAVRQWSDSQHDLLSIRGEYDSK